LVETLHQKDEILQKFLDRRRIILPPKKIGANFQITGRNFLSQEEVSSHRKRFPQYIVQLDKS